MPRRFGFLAWTLAAALWGGCGEDDGADVFVEPSNLPADTCDMAGSKDLTVGATESITIDTSGSCDATLAQTGGPDICVFKYANIDIADDGTVTVSGNRALVLVGTDSVVVNGLIDVSAAGDKSGPGAVTDRTGGAGGARENGGGGGGFGTQGALGGLGGGSTATAGAAGVAYGTEPLTPLMGGAPGGSNGPAASRLAMGGGGGGALHLVSCADLNIGATAVLDAGGGGGQGGPGGTSFIGAGAGGGGGAGGALLIEAVSVTIASGAVLVANGGGGGGGGVTSTSATTPGANGAPGEDARRSVMAAAGGDGPVENGSGGSGGVAGTAPTEGENASVSTGVGGGGGGAVGRIRINVRMGSSPKTSGAVISPAPTTGPVNVRP